VKAAAAGLALVLMACGAGAQAPASLDTRNDACAECRMTVSNRRFASQIVAPGEEPKFFDDLGCLANYLRDHPSLPGGAIAYVSDHRSGDWVPAPSAVYTKVQTLATPMDSHVMAHATAASRDADADARGGVAVDVGTFFTRALPDGTR
jgi:copper chaperone NosL